MKKSESKGLVQARPARMVSPFEAMERRFEEFFRRPFSMMGFPWWSGLEAAEGEIAPSVDIYEEGGDVVVKSELPGMKKEDIEVNLTEDSITISGEKKKEEKVEKKGYSRLERSYGSFTRSFGLPSEVRTEEAKAKFKDGILEIRIPKTEEAKRKARKVSID
ncbi:MAG TPA: Hsp20/alpha crystallin family protein [Candidatus Deferrimicrobiaceae bacterium]|nr:Hsp20/alpha crystallin family protein [Candidatus Deferrimicrobiaceae bacterium]